MTGALHGRRCGGGAHPSVRPHLRLWQLVPARGCWVIFPRWRWSIYLYTATICYPYLPIPKDCRRLQPYPTWLDCKAHPKYHPHGPVASLTAPPRLCSVPEAWSNLVFAVGRKLWKTSWNSQKRRIFLNSVLGFWWRFQWPKWISQTQDWKIYVLPIGHGTRLKLCDSTLSCGHCVLGDWGRSHLNWGGSCKLSFHHLRTLKNMANMNTDDDHTELKWLSQQINITPHGIFDYVLGFCTCLGEGRFTFCGHRLVQSDPGGIQFGIWLYKGKPTFLTYCDLILEV